jgi:hypothetical protein
MREALNSDHIASRIFTESGIKLEIIDGKKEAEIIFSGTASKVNYLEKLDANTNMAPCGGKIATFKISKVWKGGSQKNLDVFSDDGCLSLGSYFEEGKDYLVYAYPKSSERMWGGRDRNYEYNTDACVRTAPSDDAETQKDIKLLESKQKINSDSNSSKNQ